MAVTGGADDGRCLGAVSHILTLYIGGGDEGGFGVITRFKKSIVHGANIPTPEITV